MNDLEIEVKDKDGNLKKYEVLHTFCNNDINYVIYTDNTYDKNKLNVYASTYHMFNKKIVLDPVCDDFSYKLVQEKIKEFVDGDY